ncbi:hypothetical protein PSECIP111854_02043 [Pseudoalteromonas sp. CIP111854]|uniref:Uncharacterized protein n=1 Tax=Pseudoalteromonas holothuriae TaxID=2963714 RepID=A0A9W4QXR6_9GAMM|nr:hypothetical protein [Pseudoalteromonas sp. CIP111854]CAH9057663.1 hypothetical protein PSECIP111854_02043 [Pseudoalteromonas sp. CIP111854]
MSNTIANAVQTLTNKIVNGTLTPQENAQIGVAINQLTSGANVESALVAIAEQHLDTATGSLGQSTETLNSAKEAFAAQATQELSKIPELISSINSATQKSYHFSQSPVTAIQSLNYQQHPQHYNNTSYQAPSSYISIEDFDTKEMYFYYDRGSHTSSTGNAYNYISAKLGKINVQGEVEVISRKVMLTQNAFGYGLTPYHDDSVRLFTSNANYSSNSALTINIHKVNSWSIDTSILMDFSAFKVRKSDRALIYVRGGKAYCRTSSGEAEMGKAIENKSAFEQEFTAQKGFYTVQIRPYYSHSNNSMASTSGSTDKVVCTPPKFVWSASQYEFSREHGLTLGQKSFPVDLYGDSWLPYYRSTNADYSGFSRYLGVGHLAKTTHSDERLVNVSIGYRKRDTDTIITQYDCHIVAVSRQHNKMIYISSSSIETTEGIAQAI